MSKALPIFLAILSVFLVLFLREIKSHIKERAEAEEEQRKLLDECEKSIPVMSKLLHDLFKNEKTVIRKEAVGIICNNLNRENIDLLMLYINDAKIYDEVNLYLSKLAVEVGEKGLTADKEELESLSAQVNLKSSALYDHLFS